MAVDFDDLGFFFVAPGTQVDYEPRYLLSGFGDGYLQRAADGLNPNPST